jgi:hypothetical protein
VKEFKGQLWVTVCCVCTCDSHVFGGAPMYIGFVTCGIFKQYLVVFFFIFVEISLTKKMLYNEEYFKFC